MLALSSKPWLGWVDLQGHFSLAPASYERQARGAVPLRAVPRGHGGVLREHAAGPGCRRLGENFNAASEKLRYHTPAGTHRAPRLANYRDRRADQSCVPFMRREGPGRAGGRRAGFGRARGRKPRRRLWTPRDAAPTRKTSRRQPAEQFGAPKAPARGRRACAWWIRVCPREPDEADRRA